MCLDSLSETNWIEHLSLEKIHWVHLNPISTQLKMTHGQLYCSFSFYNNKHRIESLGKRIWHIRFIIALERKKNENKTKLYNIKKKISVIAFLLQMIDSF